MPTPVAADGYEFDSWTPVFPGTVTENVTYTASFKLLPSEELITDVTIDSVAKDAGLSGNSPYQLMKINYNRIADLEKVELEIVKDDAVWATGLIANPAEGG